MMYYPKDALTYDEAMKKIDSETEKKMGKFGNIPGLF